MTNKNRSGALMDLFTSQSLNSFSNNTSVNVDVTSFHVSTACQDTQFDSSPKPGPRIKQAAQILTLPQEKTRESFEDDSNTRRGALTWRTCCCGLVIGMLLADIILLILLALWLSQIRANSVRDTTTVGSLTIASLTNPCSSNGTRWNSTGIIYAGTGINGSTLNQLYSPAGLHMDSDDTLYIVDSNNYRVMAYSYNANSGSIVAGTGTSGKNLTQLGANSRYIYADLNRNIYVSDKDNARVMKWTNGNPTGTIVSGNGSAGNALSQVNQPYGVWVDSNSNVFVAELSNHRVTKWVPGNAIGTVVAGVNGSAGNTTTRLNKPTGIFYDEANQDLYISNYGASTVMKWRVGAINGTIIAGISGNSGSNAAQLNGPTGITVDQWKNLYVNDRSNQRIQLFCKNNSTGITIAGQGSGGTALAQPYAIQLDSRNNLYVAEYNGDRVTKFNKL